MSQRNTVYNILRDTYVTLFFHQERESLEYPIPSTICLFIFIGVCNF